MRVLVCRPSDEAEETARRLTEIGFEPVIAPVLVIVPVPVVLPLTGIDGLVLTSRHAVGSLADADLDRHRHLPAFAVGRSTAEAARARGFRDIRTAAGDASSLPDLIQLTMPKGRRLLYLAGRVHKPTLPATLRRSGYSIDLRESYEARPSGPWPVSVARLLRNADLQACLHFSRRSASLAIAAAEAAGGLVPFLRLRHGCLSQDVATPLTDSGATDIVIASAPREASLVQGLCASIP